MSRNFLRKYSEWDSLWFGDHAVADASNLQKFMRGSLNY
jgi:hypothetical protein